jgi:hypothetical protein
MFAHALLQAVCVQRALPPGLATRTFRVFVSSTFEDLKEERDALQRDVFPKLRTLCGQHGARFQAIDLRWGVRDEAALDHGPLGICNLCGVYVPAHALASSREVSTRTLGAPLVGARALLNLAV